MYMPAVVVAVGVEQSQFDGIVVAVGYIADVAVAVVVAVAAGCCFELHILGSCSSCSLNLGLSYS